MDVRGWLIGEAFFQFRGAEFLFIAGDKPGRRIVFEHQQFKMESLFNNRPIISLQIHIERNNSCVEFIRLNLSQEVIDAVRGDPSSYRNTNSPGFDFLNRLFNAIKNRFILPIFFE